MAQRPRNPDKSMEHISEFDLNTALRGWLEALAQSPHFQKENVAELESHVRDSVGQLQSHGLSAEESFLIATRRVGSMEKLEGEFAKVNPSPLNKIIHGVILVCFGWACLCLWGMVNLTFNTYAHMGRLLPAFTQFIYELRSLFWLLPALAAVYCLFVWFRKNSRRHSWVGFFAVMAGVLVVISFSTVLAVWLPLLDFINHLPNK
jgi:hypothetical protein